jgi:hypothetical protein
MRQSVTVPVIGKTVSPKGVHNLLPEATDCYPIFKRALLRWLSLQTWREGMMPAYLGVLRLEKLVRE